MQGCNLKTNMYTRKGKNLFGIVLAIFFAMTIIGVIYVAPTSINDLQIVVRIFFVVAIIAAFAIIRKKVKSYTKK